MFPIQVDPTIARHHGAGPAMLDWPEEPVCSRWQSRGNDMLLSGGGSKTMAYSLTLTGERGSSTRLAKAILCAADALPGSFICPATDHSTALEQLDPTDHEPARSEE